MARGVGAARRPFPGRGAAATLLAAAGAAWFASTEQKPGGETGEAEQKENEGGEKDHHGYGHMPKSS